MKKVSSLYVHFPFCIELCNYCDFYKNKLGHQDQIKQFQNQMLQSLIPFKKLMDQYQQDWGAMETLYLGGGTPSLWGDDGAKFFKKFLKELGLELSQLREFTMELNPSSFSLDNIKSWIDSGVNRFSVGVQSTKLPFLNLLDRAHGEKEIFKTLEILNSLGVNFSVDLMLGLPKSIDLKRDVLSEIDEMLFWGPAHFSVYVLTTNSHYKHSKYLPHEDYIFDEYLQVAEYLKAKGYEHYEVSNYSRDQKYSAHNLKYWKSESVMAVGPSATGLLFISEHEAVRYKWGSSGLDYKTEQLGRNELLLEKFYLNFRTQWGVALNEFIPLEKIYQLLPLFEEWNKKDLAHFDQQRYKLTATSKGMLSLDGLVGQIMSLVPDFCS